MDDKGDENHSKYQRFVVTVLSFVILHSFIKMLIKLQTDNIELKAT